MNARFLRIVWTLLVLGVVIFGLQAQPAVTATVTPDGGQPYSALAPTFWIIPAVIFVVVITALDWFKRRPLAGALAALRARPVLYWFLLLVFVVYTLGYWIDKEEPTYGRWLTAFELCYASFISWGFLLLLAYGMDTPQARAMGTKLGKSRLTGVLVTLTTITIIFFSAEAYLRLFYITTDGYGFTSMNYWWYKNFLWGHENSLGYRDYEPQADPDGNAIKRVAVVGDSFAVGHGIDSIDNTFPQLLEKKLGAGYDVNLIATSGWDSDVETGYLNAYYENMKPRLPKYVVLSYYINDIDYLLKDPSVNPDAVFSFPKNPTLAWFVLQYFVPNYIYYNLLQFTSPTRTVNFVERLINAHVDDQVWKEQEATLQEMIDWSKTHDAQMVLLLWPHIAAVQDSQPATQRVSEFFASQGALVVDMSTVLADKNPRDMTLNRFDTHPSIAAHELAAQQLYEAIEKAESVPAS